MMRYIGLICYQPGDFNPTRELREFRDRMRSGWPQDDPMVQDKIFEAEVQLVARQLAGKPDRVLSGEDAKKFWALTEWMGELFPAGEWHRVLASLRDPNIYPQDNPIVQQAIRRGEHALSLPRDAKGWVITTKAHPDEAPASAAA